MHMFDLILQQIKLRHEQDLPLAQLDHCAAQDKP